MPLATTPAFPQFSTVGYRHLFQAMKTPKANVQRKYPHAYAAKIGDVLWVIMPVVEIGRSCIGMGKNALCAWRDAEKKITENNAWPKP